MPVYKNETDKEFYTKHGGEYDPGQEKVLEWYDNDSRLTKISDDPIPGIAVVLLSEDVELAAGEERSYAIPVANLSGDVLCSIIALSGSAIVTYNDDPLGVPVDSSRYHFVAISSKYVEKITIKSADGGIFSVTMQEDISQERG
jgi:hypothetical protein